MNNDILEGKIDIPSLNNVKLFKYQIQKLDQYFAELHQETHTYPTCKKDAHIAVVIRFGYRNLRLKQLKHGSRRILKMK